MGYNKPMGDDGIAAETDAVVAANARFYEAHEANDLAVMEQVWERSERVVCVHPGWPIVRGWHDVIETWRRIFGGPQRLQFILTNIDVVIEGDVAVVTLDENLVDDGRTATIACSNVFIRVGGQWLMTVHHGSGVG